VENLGKPKTKLYTRENTKPNSPKNKGGGVWVPQRTPYIGRAKDESFPMKNGKKSEMTSTQIREPFIMKEAELDQKEGSKKKKEHSGVRRASSLAKTLSPK